MNKNFSLLLVGQAIATIGDVLYMVAVISKIFVLTGSAAVSSFVPFTVTLSMFSSNLLTPLLIGKVNLKWLIAGSQVGKTVLIVVLSFVLIGVTVSNFYWIFLIIALIAFLDGCANPIKQTLIPHYVELEHLVQANGLSETTTQVIQTVMWFVGSFLLLVLGSLHLIMGVAGLFGLSSILLGFLDNVSHQTNRTVGTFEPLKEGWKTLVQIPLLKTVALMELLENMAGTVWMAAILLVFVREALHVDQKWWGFINGAFFLGLIFGSVYCVRYSSFVEKKISTFILVGSTVSFVVTLMFSLNKFPMIALMLSFCVGIFGQLKTIPQQTAIQTSVPKEQLSTVYTSLSAIGTGAFGVSSLAMGFLSDWLGIRVVFAISALLLAAVSRIVLKNKSLFVRKVAQE
ncbi:MFS transporter [Pullulanibacillus sp. KACC 23026]|uniref:MFS transporter n=1 Tax=Pullulanibacillus sp. KACC 23026 TaxID=3028315 RepID=UPI0023AF65C2|nr:MFS transporter [Pullulanibacillus sp. KACC 23026]WEG11696.1 MFS transporter [Pullulanibacillus sp. KACC 23026]